MSGCRHGELWPWGRIKFQDCNELRRYEKYLMWKSCHHEKVAMEVVDESYLVFPQANEGPLCILVKNRYVDIKRTVTRVGESVKIITSRDCGGVQERSALAWWITLNSKKRRYAKGWVYSLCWVAWTGTLSTVSTWSAGMDEHLEKIIMVKHPQ